MKRTLSGWKADYLATLKPIEIEEPLDLFFYRPLAYLWVRIACHTPITANQVTLLSVVFGFVAGALLSTGHDAAVRWAAVGVLAFNVFDCADGMLARARGQSSPLGYVLDGLAGYIGTAPIMLGLGQAAVVRHGHPAFWWSLTVAAVLSLAWWCAVVDGLRLEWMRRVYGQRTDRASELTQLEDAAAQWRQDGTHRAERLLVRAYTIYVRLWEGRSRRAPALNERAEPAVEAWAEAHRPILRLAVFTGPTAQLTAVIIAVALQPTRVAAVGCGGGEQSVGRWCADRAVGDPPATVDHGARGGLTSG